MRREEAPDLPVAVSLTGGSEERCERDSRAGEQSAPEDHSPERAHRGEDPAAQLDTKLHPPQPSPF